MKRLRVASTAKARRMGVPGAEGSISMVEVDVDGEKREGVVYLGVVVEGGMVEVVFGMTMMCVFEGKRMPDVRRGLDDFGS